MIEANVRPDRPTNRLLGVPFYVIRGAMFIRNNRSLWRFAAGPTVFSALILGGAYMLLYHFYSAFAGYFEATTWYGRVLVYALLAVMTVALLIVFFFLFTRIASALSAPFNDLISQHTEALVTGAVPETPFSLAGLLKDSGRSLVHSLRVLGLYLAMVVPALVLLLIPVVGGPLYAVVSALISSYMSAYEYLGYPMDRRRYTWDQKRSFLRARWKTAVGFGLGNVAMASIPLVNIFFIPAAVVGGTLLFLELTGGEGSQPCSSSSNDRNAS